MLSHNPGSLVWGITREGPEGVKWELGFAYFYWYLHLFLLGKWDLGHWDWDSQTLKWKWEARQYSKNIYFTLNNIPQSIVTMLKNLKRNQRLHASVFQVSINFRVSDLVTQRNNYGRNTFSYPGSSLPLTSGLELSGLG